MKRFSLESVVNATVDQQSAEQAGQDLAQTMEEQVGDLNVGVDDGGGVGSLGGARGGGGLGAAAGGGLAARGLGGAAGAASAVLPVALAGAAGFGILQGIQALAGASPALKQTTSILGSAMELFFRPFGNALSDVIRPFATEALDMAVRFNQIADSDGLSVAVGKYSAGAVSSLAGAVGTAFTDILGGEGTLGDWLVAGTTAVSATALITGQVPAAGLITGTSITSLLSGGSVASLLAVSPAAAVLGTVAASAVIAKVSADTLFHTTDLETLMDSGAAGPGTQGERDTSGVDFSTLPEFARDSAREMRFGEPQSTRGVRERFRDIRRTERGAGAESSPQQTDRELIQEVKKQRREMEKLRESMVGGALASANQEDLDPY